MPLSNRTGERGNAMMIVFVALVLFVALMFTFSRSIQQGGENLSVKNAQLTAADILTYVQKIQRTVDRVRSRGISENDISFENNFETGYENPNCPAGNEDCRVFSESQGVEWRAPPQGATTGTWVFSGSNYVNGLGAVGDDTDAELLLILPNIDIDVCDEINRSLGIDGIPQELGNSDITTKFTGTFNPVPELIEDRNGLEFQGDKAGCYEGDTGSTPGPGTYHYFHVLMQRP